MKQRHGMIATKNMNKSQKTQRDLEQNEARYEGKGIRDIK